MEFYHDILENLLDKLIDYRGKTPKKTLSGVPLVTAKIVKNGTINGYTEYIAEEDYDKWMVRGFPKVGDVILTTEAPLGEVALLKEKKVALAQRIVCLRGKDNVLDNTYLKYYLQSGKGQKSLSARESGTTVTGIKQAELRRVDIEYPAYDDQRRIASILSSLDRKIELNNKINADLEEMAQAIFKNWFVDFEPFKDGKFVDSELGMIPEGWKVGCLGDIAEITSGKRPPKKSKDKTKELFIPLIGASDIMGFTSDVLYERPILVIGRVGTHGVVQRFQEKCWPSDNTLVIESSYYNYVYQLLKGIDYSAINRGSTQPLITQTDVKNTDVIIAPENVLKEYESITSTLFSKHRANIKENSRLSLLRDTLLPRLMSGELEVPE